MSQRVKPTTADYKAWAKAILETGRNVTDWEKHFAEDMKELLDLRGYINDAQAKKLEDIYADRTPL